MENNLSVEELKISFKGENDIDLNTFSNSLKAVVDSLTKIADSTIGENDYCKFKVMNIEKGSFVIVIQSILEAAPTLMPYVPTVLNTFKTILEIKKHFGGKEPKEIKAVENQIKVTNNNGVINNFSIDAVNIYLQSNDIEKATSKLMEVVNSDVDRNGIELGFTDDKGNTKEINFSVDDVRKLSKPLDVEKFNLEDEIEIIETNLVVTKLDLEGNSKWTVYMATNRINVDIQDKKFYELIHNRQIYFVANMKIKAKVRIKYKKLASGLPDTKNKASYSVIEVLEVEQQGKMTDIAKLELKLFK